MKGASVTLPEPDKVRDRGEPAQHTGEKAGRGPFPQYGSIQARNGEMPGLELGADTSRAIPDLAYCPRLGQDALAGRRRSGSGPIKVLRENQRSQKVG